MTNDHKTYTVATSTKAQTVEGKDTRALLLIA